MLFWSIFVRLSHRNTFCFGLRHPGTDVGPVSLDGIIFKQWQLAWQRGRLPFNAEAARSAAIGTSNWSQLSARFVAAEAATWPQLTADRGQANGRPQLAAMAKFDVSRHKIPFWLSVVNTPCEPLPVMPGGMPPSNMPSPVGITSAEVFRLDEISSNCRHLLGVGAWLVFAGARRSGLPYQSVLVRMHCIVLETRPVSPARVRAIFMPARAWWVGQIPAASNARSARAKADSRCLLVRAAVDGCSPLAALVVASTNLANASWVV